MDRDCSAGASKLKVLTDDTVCTCGTHRSVEVALHYLISMSEASGTLQAFAECAEAVAATTKKLEKAAILGAYLQALSDPDLTRAARYFAGHQFASSDARTTNVGGSIISAALSEADRKSVVYGK